VFGRGRVQTALTFECAERVGHMVVIGATESSSGLIAQTVPHPVVLNGLNRGGPLKPSGGAGRQADAKAYANELAIVFSTCGRRLLS